MEEKKRKEPDPAVTDLIQILADPSARRDAIAALAGGSVAGGAAADAKQLETLEKLGRKPSGLPIVTQEMCGG